MASPFMTGPFVPVAMLNLIRAVLGIHHHRFNLSVKRSSGEIDRAIADYDRTIELDPMDADAHVGRGRARYQKKDYAAAIADYDAALRLVPDDVEALTEPGDAHERAGLY